MPTVGELERLDALVNRLLPLANAQRGTPVRAQDWNEVVGTLIEVARLILAEEREGVVAAHEHPDQVKMSWLDPMLRTVVERGPLADPAAVTRVADVERRLGRLTDRIAAVDAGAKEARDQATSVSTRDLVREAQVTAVRRTVEGLSDARDSILELRNSLRAIEGNVATAVDVGQRLIVDGQPIDFAAWNQRLQSVEELRTRLTLPDGGLLDANGLEIRLAELTNTFVTEEELDEILANRPLEVPPEALESIREGLRSEIMAQVQASLTTLGDEIRAEITERLAGVDGQVAQAISDAVPGVVDTVLGAVRPEIADAAANTLSQAQAMLDQRLQEFAAEVNALVEQRMADLELKIEPAVAAEFERQLPNHIGEIHQMLASLGAGLDEANRRLDKHDELLAGLMQPDDFTRIQGLSVDHAQLLVQAGVRTYRQLAAMTPKQIELITHIPQERVILLKIIPQAEDLAAHG